MPPYPAETPYVFDFEDLFVLVALSLPLLLPVDFPVVEASEESPVEDAPEEAAALLSEPVVEAALLSDEASLSDDFAVDLAEDSAVDFADEASAVEDAAAVDSAAVAHVNLCPMYMTMCRISVPELSCRGKTKSFISRMALRWKDSDHGADAELSAEKRAIEDRSCAARILNV